MVEPPPNAENSRTRSPASDGKKWGVASIRADDCSDSSAQTSRLAVPPRAGTSWSLCESLGGLAELKTISSPSALQAPPPPPPPKKNRAGHFANPDSHPALNRDFLELRAGSKPDEITVWRPKRPPSSFGAFDGPWFLPIEVLNPQLSLRTRGDKRDMPSVG